MSARHSGLICGAGLSVVAALVLAACGGDSASIETTSRAASISTARSSLADLVQRVRSGVVSLEIDVCSGGAVRPTTGSGFLVGPTLVATVHHAVEGAGRIIVKRGGKKLATATVIGQEAGRDLALLRLSKPVHGHVFRLSQTGPRIGDRIAALGYPPGLPLTWAQGTIRGLNRTIRIENARRHGLAQSNALVTQGQSGGPLVRTATGEVVGIVDSRSGSDMARPAFAVSARVAAPLLHTWRRAPQPVALHRCSKPPALAPTAATAPLETVRSFVQALDRVLIQSAHTHGDVGQLVSEVQRGAIGAAEAQSRIGAIIGQRSALRSTVEHFTPPSEFKDAFAVLHESIELLLEDDLAVRNWIGDLINGDQTAADNNLQRQLVLSNRASLAKRAFLAQYNDLRMRLLELPALEVDY
jgi:S1-C subfamily serine protease